MMALRYAVVSAVFALASAAAPCDRRLGPCDPITASPVTAAPTTWIPMQQATTRPTPVLPTEQVCFADGTFQTNPGAFKPWSVYKYLKANGPFIKTVSKDLMGGQTLKVRNAAKPLQVTEFGCVKEDNEWKARVTTSGVTLNMLTIQLHNGWCDDVGDPSKLPGIQPSYCLQPVELCLLQDISLYRSVEDKLGLRLDYGNCPIPATPGTRLPGSKHATIMIGLKRVPDNSHSPNPNVKGFFQDVCYQKDLAAPALKTQLDFTKAKVPNVNQTCFARTADMEAISALNHAAAAPCFNDSVVYTFLDAANRFPALPVTDSDYAWLLSKVPAPRDQTEGPCAPVNRPKQVLGQVTMDRVCIELEGMQDVSCTNVCGKTCNGTTPQSGTTTPGAGGFRPPEICIDCELYEAIYAFIATALVVMLSYYTYLANSLSWVSTWFFVPLPKGSDGCVPHETFEQLEEKNVPNHHELNPKLFAPAVLGLFAVTGLWSFVIYYVINLFDMLICWAVGMEQCIRTIPQQYFFDEEFYYRVNGTFSQETQSQLTLAERGQMIIPWEGPNRAINIGWCPFRLLGMICVTWLSTWVLMCQWRKELPVSIMKTTVTQEVIAEEGGLLDSHMPMGGSANGPGGMLTKTLAFFGGGHVPSTPDE